MNGYSLELFNAGSAAMLLGQWVIPEHKALQMLHETILFNDIYDHSAWEIYLLEVP